MRLFHTSANHKLRNVAIVHNDMIIIIIIIIMNEYD